MLKDEKGKDRTDSNKNPIAKEINLTDIMDNTFADYEVYKPQLSPKFKPNKVDTLKGEFTPTQAKRFFEKYDILIHQPNTESGFSATIFYDIKESNTTTNTKEFEKHFEYIITLYRHRGRY